MRFKVMTWESENVRPNSIFGVLEDGTDALLPIPTRCGIWVDYHAGDEAQFEFADEAKKAIEVAGFYLFGAGAALTRGAT
jgi:hypothetical protein